MTTGRINQVTTESPRRRPLGPTTPQSVVDEDYWTWNQWSARTSFVLLRVCHEQQTTVASSSSSSSYEYVDHDNDRRELPLSSVRLPNTPCEVGIFKTVELLTELHRPDIYDQSELDTVTLARRRLSSNEYVYPLFDRLSAGERQCRPLESKLARRN